MSKRHADSTSDENPSKRRRCEADEVSVATAFENVCKWCREDKPELLEEVLSKEFAPDTSNVRRLDAHSRSYSLHVGYHSEEATPLMNCAYNDHIECLILLLDAGAGIDVASPSGRTALHFAAMGNLDCLSELITRGASVVAVDSTGNTALHASTHGDSLIVDMLLKGGISVDARNKVMQTPLHVACQHHKLYTAVALLEAGASVVAVDCDGDTALHYEVALDFRFPYYEPQSDVVNMLLERGASVDACNKVMQTPLHIACACDNTCAALALLERGASVVAMDRKGNTALHCAVGIEHDFVRESYHRVVVDRLLEQGASVDACNKDRKTPLHVACEHDNTCAAVALLERGASVVAVDCDGNTVLHHSVGTEHNKEDVKEDHHRVVVDMLLERGASVDARNRQGETPLHLASKCGSEPAVAALLQAGASVDAVDPYRNTALHLAVGMDSNDEHYRDLLTIHALQNAVVSLLLMHGASVYARNRSRRTPLIAASNGHSNDWVVRTLLNMGAEVDAVDRKGNTALHCAWLSYNPWKGYDVPDTLYEFNASEDLPNNEGRTAAEIADETEYVSCLF